MINGLQVVESLGLFDAKVPGNVSTFLDSFGKLSSFEILNTENWGLNLMYLPEVEAFSLVFESAGFSSVYIIVLLGTLFVTTILLIVLVFVDVVLKLLGRKFYKVAQFREKTTQKILYWNLLIRYFMEVYINFAMCSMINLARLDWDTELTAVNFSNFFALLIMISTIVCPPIMVVHALKNFHAWQDPAYHAKSGALLEGLYLDFKDYEENEWVVILVPISYFLRRFLLCIALICAHDIFWV